MRLLRAGTLSVRTLFILFTVLLWASVASAQTFTSSITGIVTDPTGAPVANASVQLRNMGTNDVHKIGTTENGSYIFNNLNPGTYEVTVTSSGFKTFSKTNLILEANLNASVNVALELGQAEQKVEVTASSVLVDTETANNVVTMDSQLINALPNNTRNPLNFVFAVAGTTQAPGGQTSNSSTLDQMSSNFGINGGRTGDEAILIDGAPSQAVDWGGLMVSPLQDSVQEQQIVQNTYDAQYERGGAGIVTLITKGGTNAFHGEVYDYLQNSALDANSWYNNTYSLPKGQFKQNQFGGNFSGPILKRANLFFFGGYEGLRQPNTQSVLTTVPTQAERSGNFSGVLNADGTPDLIYNPFTTTVLNASKGTYTRSAFANNQIPSDLINPVGQKIINLYPLPNRAAQGANDLNNYAAQGAGNTLNDKMDTRVDWEENAIHRLFVRYSDRFRQDQVVPCFFCNGADTGNNQYNNGYQVVVNDTVTPSPTWVINTYIAYSRWKEQHIAQGYGTADASTIGLSDQYFQAPVLPTIAEDQFSSLSNGSYEQYARGSDTIQVNVTKNWGRHTLKFGSNFDDETINSLSEAVGSFTFSDALTSCDPSSGGPCTALSNYSTESGSAIASTLLGTGSSGGQGINVTPAMSLHTYGMYIQDQWRISNRLTLNVGLRYENQRPATERHNQLEYFSTTVANPVGNLYSPQYGETINQFFGYPLKGGFEYAGVNGNDRYAWAPNNLDFAPRVGVAYKITDRFVIRAGAGIFHLPPSAMISFDNPGEFYGFSSTTSYDPTNANGFVPTNLISNPFPLGINQPTGSSQGLMTLVGNGLGQIFPMGSHPTPYTEQASLDLQYQVTNHSAFEVGYTGNRGKKLLYGNPNLDADQLPDQYLSLGAKLDAQVNNPFYGAISPNAGYLGYAPTIAYNELLRVYPEFTYLQWTRSLPGARSSFNALQAKYNYQFQSGLSLLVTYQWSKALDNAPEDNFGWATGNQWRDYYNTMLDYNISTHDVPQSFATALVYDLPYGRGKHWGNSAPGIVKEVLGNWQLSSVITLQSGLPLYGLQESNSNHLNNYGFPGPELPDVLNYDVSPSNRNANNWVNASSFAPQTNEFALGNAPQRMTQLRTRALRNIDMSVAKNFGSEKYQAWLRGEFLNTFNYAQYNNFCLDISENNCPVFGAAQGTQNNPRTIQLSLKLAF